MDLAFLESLKKKKKKKMIIFKPYLSESMGVFKLFFDRVCGPRSETPTHI